MKRLGFFILLLAAIGCKEKKTTAQEEEGTEFNFESFSKRYATASLPYQLSDTALLHNKDTAAIRNASFSAFIADSTKQKIVGKTSGIRFIPIAKVEVPKGESYFITRVVAGDRQAALLTVFDKSRNYSTSFPFLLPDADATTTQVSTIDKSYTISKNVVRKTKDDVVTEGKDVYVYNAGVKQFTLIMTDILDEKNQVLINPIDTFAHKHKFSGDYVKDKKNIVSIRDSKSPSELLMFVHFEKEDGTCNGELKGTLLFTSSTTAVYRQGGDPCVLEFKFSPNAVSLHEVEGCGLHRDLKCLFDGNFPKKKEAVSKAEKKKISRKGSL